MAIASIKKGKDIESRIGSITNVSTSEFVIMSPTFTQPSTDTQMEIVSTSAQDTTSGTGLAKVKIWYFSLAWGSRKTTIVTLNGTTPVSLSVSDVFRIDDMRGITAGSGDGEGTPDGTITLQNVGGGTTYGKLDIGNNRMERAVHYLANSERSVITSVELGSSTNGGIIYRLFSSDEDVDGNVVPSGKRSVEFADMTQQFDIELIVENPRNKRIAVGLAAKGKHIDQNATGSFTYYDEVL